MLLFHQIRKWTVFSNPTFTGLIFFLTSASQIGCQDTSSQPETIASTPVVIQPAYTTNIQIDLSGDSLHFPLTNSTYNQIKSFNYFKQKGDQYISFYDRGSQSVLIYDFLSQKRVKKIHLEKVFKKEPLRNTSVYTKNFDSIYITNVRKLYLIDSSGKIKKDIDFFDTKATKAVFDNTVPPLFKNNLLYMGVRYNVEETSFTDIKKWRALYEFDFDKLDRKLFYPAPDLYLVSLYGYHFFDYSYCYNEKGDFVFSFPADTCIYKTNLKDQHIRYYAKSQFQEGAIQPVPKDSLKADKGYKEYLLRDSYGPIYYDPYNERYLRLFKKKISLTDYKSKNYTRSQTVIILDKNLKIIGETELDKDISFSSIFFTDGGGIYARTNFTDEYTLQIVQLRYKENNKDIQIAKK